MIIPALIRSVIMTYTDDKEALRIADNPENIG